MGLTAKDITTSATSQQRAKTELDAKLRQTFKNGYSQSIDNWIFPLELILSNQTEYKKYCDF